MTAAIHLKGYVRDVRYTACLASLLTAYPANDFDINAAAPAGILTFPDRETLDRFFVANVGVFNARQKSTILLLNEEAARNGLSVEIRGNTT